MNKDIENKIKTMLPLLNERQKRIYLATEAEALGHGGIGKVSEISGVSRRTISRGKKELKEENNEEIEANGIRKKGGGRKKNN